MTLFLVISYSWVQYLFISVFLYIRNSCTSARLQFVINQSLYILALFSITLIVFWAPEINGHLVPQVRAQHISWGRVCHVHKPPFSAFLTLSSTSLPHQTSITSFCHLPSPSITPHHPSTSFSLIISTLSLIVFCFSTCFNTGYQSQCLPAMAPATRPWPILG